MPTPVRAFAEIAAQHGDVDPTDLEAVQRWYLDELPQLPPSEIDEILQELVSHDGESHKDDLKRTYPQEAPLPTLSDSPPARFPPGFLWGLIQRIFGRRN